ncbi:auxiliary transport protein, MFP family [Klebsiella quasipneumoniae]|nr:auxiliary transport protein, MFP family [Klebsiella quasipneumoniae]
METLMLLTYAALCIVVFKVFRIPLNKWTVPTAVLGGIALIGAVIFGMNYNFPYTDVGNQVFRTVPIVSQVRGRVQSVPVRPNQRLHKGDVLFTLDPTPFQAKVDDLQAQIKAASQDAPLPQRRVKPGGGRAEQSGGSARPVAAGVCPLSGGACPGRLLRSNGRYPSADVESR